MIQFDPKHRRRAEPQATDDELAEYRRIRPLLLKMLEEWQVLRSPTGCPVMRNLLDK